MANNVDIQIFSYIGDAITTALDAFVSPTAKALMTGLQAVILTGVTLYIVMTGYSISTGAVETHFG